MVSCGYLPFAQQGVINADTNSLLFDKSRRIISMMTAVDRITVQTEEGHLHLFALRAKVDVKPPLIDLHPGYFAKVSNIAIFFYLRFLL